MEHLFAPTKRTPRHTYGSRGNKRQKVEKKAEGSAGIVDQGRVHHVTSSTRHSTPERASLPPVSSPVTPRKAVSASAGTTPSSSPLVKLSIERDVFNMLSPKKPKDRSTPDRAPLHSSEDSSSDDDLTSSYPSTQDRNDVVARLPSKSSFASRMAPRRAKEVSSKAGHSQNSSLYASPSSQSSSRSASLHAVHQNSPTVLSPSRHRASQVPSPWVRQKEHCVDSPNTEGEKRFSLSEKNVSDLTEMRARWSTLDEMEEDDEPKDIHRHQIQVKSITNLRSAGELRRFVDDFDYLVMDLDPKQRLGARQRSCVTIAKRVMGWDESASDAELARWQPPPARQTSFLLNIRAADVTLKLLVGLQNAGAGKGEDATIDLAFALICHRIAASGICSVDELVRGDNEIRTALRGTFSTTYLTGKANVHFKFLERLCKSCQLGRAYCNDVTPRMVACHTLASLFSSARNTSLVYRTENDLLVTDFWANFQKTDFDAVESIACSELSINALGRMTDSLSVLVKRHPNWLDTIIRQIDILASLDQGLERAGCIELLSSYLRFLVIATHGKDLENSVAIGSHSKATPTIAQVALTSVHNSQSLGGDDIRAARWMDIAALALGILTNLLEKVVKPTVALLLRNGHLLQGLGRLYCEQFERRNDEQAAILSGCIAVALSLLILNGEPSTQEAVVRLIKLGVGIESTQSLCTHLATCLDHFADLTGALKKTPASPSIDQGQALSTSASTRDWEDNLVRQLSLHLRRLCGGDSKDE